MRKVHKKFYRKFSFIFGLFLIFVPILVWFIIYYEKNLGFETTFQVAVSSFIKEVRDFDYLNIKELWLKYLVAFFFFIFGMWLIFSCFWKCILDDKGITEKVWFLKKHIRWENIKMFREYKKIIRHRSSVTKYLILEVIPNRGRKISLNMDGFGKIEGDIKRNIKDILKEKGLSPKWIKEINIDEDDLDILSQDSSLYKYRNN